MGEAHAKARQRLYQAEAQAKLDQRVRERQSTEQMLIQQEMMLGSPEQISGNLAGGVAQQALPYTQRYSLDPGITVSQRRIGQINTALGNANDLMGQAQAAAEAGDLQLAEQLRAQADAAAYDFRAGEKSSVSSFISLQQDPSVAAATRLNSPLAQAVGQQVAMGRAYSDPNSSESRRLFSQVVDQPVSEIRQGTQQAVGALNASRSSALARVDSGFAQALSEITGGEVRALAEIDSNFAAALQSLDVGRANSITEINNGLSYALEAVQLQAENARRALDAGLRQTRAQVTMGLRAQGGGAARAGVSQAIQSRAEEGFATQRARTFTDQGQQQAALSAAAASEKAGIEMDTGMAKGQLQARQGELSSGVIMSAAQQRSNVQYGSAELAAQIEMQAGLAEAQIRQQGALAAADLMSRGTMAVEEFRANYSFAATQNAQAFLQNQGGVREQFQASMDNLAMAQAQLADTAAGREFQMAQMYTQFELEWDAMLKEFYLGEAAGTLEGGRQIGIAWATRGMGGGTPTNPLTAGGGFGGGGGGTVAGAPQ